MNRIAELLEIMARLRSPQGCPWDKEQSFASIAPYTIEEAYEVADAIAQNDLPHLQDELGDLLFQVVFHAQMAAEQGAFSFDDVVQGICEKLKRRHPHVFSNHQFAGDAERSASWEAIKASERASAGDGSALQGIPRALPALLRADKLSKRAARVGFDFAIAEHSADKVSEELAEVRAEITGYDPQRPTDAMIEEIGDLLFACANLARKVGVNSEEALRQANDKFERRFRAMELKAKLGGQAFAELDLEAQEGLWQAVKRDE